MLHAQNLSFIQIWYTRPFVYKANFEREAYNKITTQYVRKYYLSLNTIFYWIRLKVLKVLFENEKIFTSYKFFNFVQLMASLQNFNILFLIIIYNTKLILLVNHII